MAVKEIIWGKNDDDATMRVIQPKIGFDRKKTLNSMEEIERKNK